MRYYMVNKPYGYVSARCDSIYPAVLDLVPDSEGLHIAGRLDVDATGLLIATDDGDLTFRLTRPEFKIAKSYYFKAFGKLSADDIKRIESGGLTLGDGSLSKPAEIGNVVFSTVSENESSIPEKIRRHCMKNPCGSVVSGVITVTEGKFHEVKQILHDTGCRIFLLRRIRMGEIELDGKLAEGEYREFTVDEMKILMGYKKMYIENI